MPGIITRRRYVSAALPQMGKAALVVVTLLLLIPWTAAVVLGYKFAALRSSYPSISRIETYTGSPGSGIFLPTRFFDSTGTHALYEAVHPSADGRQWLGSGQERGIPAIVREAVLACQPRAFSNHTLLEMLFQQEPYSIPEQLVKATLIRSPGSGGSPWMTELMIRLLGAELQSAYSEDQILEWYLNSAYFGNLAYGIDAAGLVYFGKQADELSTGEAALLAALPLNPSANPADSPVIARRLRAQVLDAMAEDGFITRTQADRALKEPLDVREDVKTAVPVELRILWDELNRVLPGADARSGIRAVTNLDLELHSAANCLLSPEESDDPGGACSTLSLSGIHPASSGAGPEHDFSASWIVQDPESGAILSFGGDINKLHTLGSAVDPLIYLAAYAQGSSPSTMVLDVPDGQPEHGMDMEDYAGPVRMRLALKNSYPGARSGVLARTGLEPVFNAGYLLGIEPEDFVPGEDHDDLLLEMQATLLQLNSMHAVFANGGRLAGRFIVEADAGNEGENDPEPVFLQRVEDPAGELYQVEKDERFLVSRQLAFLLVDSLRNTPTDEYEPCCPAPYDSGLWAAHQGIGTDGRSSWVMGSTPKFTIGLRMVVEDAGQDTEALSRNAWDALAGFIEGKRETGNWIEPPGMERVEVCDPSGLLPTPDCQVVVEELFIRGSTPAAYDTYYQSAVINRETGRLATVFTPARLRQEKIYPELPAIALSWAAESGISRLPEVYDTITLQQMDEAVFVEPAPYDVVRGPEDLVLQIDVEDAELIRIQAGQGLYPSEWLLLEELEKDSDQEKARVSFDTEELSGLVVLQAVLVDDDNRVTFSSIPIIVDNEEPVIEVRMHTPGDVFAAGEDFVIEAVVEDNYGVERVDLFLDDEKIEQWESAPYQVRLSLPEGLYRVYARAFDEAGNAATTEPLLLEVVP